jgi:hypothetical protein
MFDEKILDGRTFDELRRALNLIRERIDKIEDELEEGEDDLRLDAFYTIANSIIRRMDAIVREFARDNPGDFSRWDNVMRGYEAHYDKYTDSILEDDTLLDLESPEDS